MVQVAAAVTQKGVQQLCVVNPHQSVFEPQAIAIQILGKEGKSI